MKSKLVFASIYTLGLLFLALGFLIFLVMYVYDFYDLGSLIVFVIVFNIFIWLVNPYITDLIHRWLFKMKFLTREELRNLHPEAEAFIGKITQQEKIRFPKIGLISDDNPTAYTYGSGAFNARVIMTQGLFIYLQPDEVEAVLAHELGHIVHRDFIVMAVANTVIQIFYLIFRWLLEKKSKGSNSSGNGSGGGGSGARVIVAVVAYLFYIIGFYIVLYLNRVREAYADEYSAQVTGKPASLSQALIKIGYGIMAKEDSDASTQLMGQTETLGIMGIRSAKSAGLIAKVTNMEPEKISKVLVYDFVSPWAKLGELVSTHPLIGKRLAALDEIAKKAGQPAMFNIEQAIADANIDKKKLWSGFSTGAFIYFLPMLSLVGAPIFLFIYQLLTSSFLSPSVFVAIWLWWFGVAMLINTVYKFPTTALAGQKTIYELMTDPYASPAQGVPVKVEGSVVGKGIPGYAFSEDVMLQDSTGLIYLDYQAGIPLIGNIIFAWKKVQQILGKQALAGGWFFRSSFHFITLSHLTVDGKEFKSYTVFWNVAMSVVIFLAAWVLGVAGFGVIQTLWVPILLAVLIGYSILRKRNGLVTASDKAKAKEQQFSLKRVGKGIMIGVLILIVIIVIAVIFSNFN